MNDLETELQIDHKRLWIGFITGLYGCGLLLHCLVKHFSFCWLFLVVSISSLLSIVCIRGKEKAFLELLFLCESGYEERDPEVVLRLTLLTLYDRIGNVVFHIAIATLLVGIMLLFLF